MFEREVTAYLVVGNDGTLEQFRDVLPERIKKALSENKVTVFSFDGDRFFAVQETEFPGLFEDFEIPLVQA